VSRLRSVVLIFLGWAALTANAQNVIEEGLEAEVAQQPVTNTKAKIETCVACHGLDGKGITPDIPNIGGQYEAFLLKELLEYKNGERSNPIMMGMVAQFNEEDLAGMAAYYAKQDIVVGEADPELVDWGEKIYRGGIVSEQVPACIACHGPQGEGNELANFPKLSGQNAQYVVNSLKAFKEDQREGGPNDMMHSVVHHMTTYDMEAVASYIQGLH
jgi:cytochrome c553